jgi:hypothetical protein
MRDERAVRRVVREENRVEPSCEVTGVTSFQVVGGVCGQTSSSNCTRIVCISACSITAPLLQFTPMFGSSCEFFVIPASSCAAVGV